MKIKTSLFILAVLPIILTSILPSFSISPAVGETSFNPASSSVPESHLIEGVPYVGQETSFFCAYASLTMLLKYFGDKNTTLQDVLYFSGVGYSLIYPSFLLERMPMTGIDCSQSSKDKKFLTSLYGLTYEGWSPKNDTIPYDKCWEEYWARVKENISNDKPILTSVYSYRLSSLRKIMDLPYNLWDLISPDGDGHAIIIVGYNESNQTVCYNDPAVALFGHPEYGTYAWMNLSEFDEAIARTSGPKYAIFTLKKISEPMSREEAFNRAHEINIKKLRGDISLYGNYLVNMSNGSGFGINGSKLLKNDLERGLKNRIKTIAIYKLRGKLGIKYRLFKNAAPIIAVFLKLPSNAGEKFTVDAYHVIAIEKNYTAKFLYKNSNLSNICEYEAMLFEQEAKYWDDLSSCYSIFMKKGIFLSLPHAILILDRMSSIMDKIIEIQETIVKFEE